MFKGLMTLARPALLALDPEKAHELTLRSLEQGLFPKGGQNDHRLEQTIFGLKFNNPLGMAAGFDKNGRVTGPLFRHGVRLLRGRHGDPPCPRAAIPPRAFFVSSRTAPSSIGSALTMRAMMPSPTAC